MPSLTALGASRMTNSTNPSGTRPLNASTNRTTTAIPYQRVDRSGKAKRR